MCKTFSSFLPAIFFLILLQHTQTYALSGKFLHISDIHLDPLFNTDTDPVSACRSVSDSKHPLGIYGCDSSPALVSSTIQQMAAVDPNPDFIVVSGDLVFHGVPTEPIMNTTLINLINMFQKFYPNTLVLPVVGNHDVFVPDTIGPDDHGLAVLLSFWDNAFNNIAAQNPQATTTFLQGGYYYVPLPNNVYVIVLNTVYYLPDDTAVPNGDADPAGQFQFLRTTLDMVVNTKGRAIITQHVPQGVGRTATTQLFNPLYENTMQEIMLLYANSIMGVLTGHLHRDLFRIYYQPDGTTPAVPVLLNGAVTPTDDSNPSFTHFSYNATALLNYDKYFVDISDKDNTWELEYSFGTAFPDYPGVIDAQYLDYVLSEFKKKKILHEYEDQSVGGCSQGISGNHCFYICSTQETMFDAFQECVKNCS